MKKFRILTALTLGLLVVGGTSALAIHENEDNVIRSEALAETTPTTEGFKFQIKLLKDVGWDNFLTSGPYIHTYCANDTNLHPKTDWENNGDNIITKLSDGYEITIAKKYYDGLEDKNPVFIFHVKDGGQTNPVSYFQYTTMQIETPIFYIGANNSVFADVGQFKSTIKPGIDTARVWLDRNDYRADEGSAYFMHVYKNGIGRTYYANGYVNFGTNKTGKYLAYFDIPMAELKNMDGYGLKIYNGNMYHDQNFEWVDGTDKATFTTAKVVRVQNVNDKRSTKLDYALTEKYEITVDGKADHSNLTKVFEAYYTCLANKYNGFLDAKELRKSWLDKYTDEELNAVTFKDYGYAENGNPYEGTTKTEDASLLAKITRMETEQANHKGSGLTLFNFEDSSYITTIVIVSALAITSIAVISFLVARKKRLAK